MKNYTKRNNKKSGKNTRKQYGGWFNIPYSPNQFVNDSYNVGQGIFGPLFGGIATALNWVWNIQSSGILPWFANGPLVLYYEVIVLVFTLIGKDSTYGKIMSANNVRLEPLALIFEPNNIQNKANELMIQLFNAYTQNNNKNSLNFMMYHNLDNSIALAIKTNTYNEVTKKVNSHQWLELSNDQILSIMSHFGSHIMNIKSALHVEKGFDFFHGLSYINRINKHIPSTTFSDSNGMRFELKTMDKLNNSGTFKSGIYKGPILMGYYLGSQFNEENSVYLAQDGYFKCPNEVLKKYEIMNPKKWRKMHNRHIYDCFTVEKLAKKSLTPVQELEKNSLTHEFQIMLNNKNYSFTQFDEHVKFSENNFRGFNFIYLYDAIYNDLSLFLTCSINTLMDDTYNKNKKDNILESQQIEEPVQVEEPQQIAEPEQVEEPEQIAEPEQVEEPEQIAEQVQENKSNLYETPLSLLQFNEYKSIDNDSIKDDIQKIINLAENNDKKIGEIKKMDEYSYLKNTSKDKLNTILDTFFKNRKKNKNKNKTKKN